MTIDDTLGGSKVKEKNISFFYFFHDFSYQLGGLYKMMGNILIFGNRE